MRRLGASGLAVAIGCALLVLIGVIAYVDHDHKRRVMNRLQVDEWFCENRRQRCGGESSAAVEARWARRETVYKISFVSTAAATAAIAGATGLARRRRRRSDATHGMSC